MHSPAHMDRYVSPCGRKIALVDRESGEVWLSIRQDIVESAALLRELPEWKPLRASRGAISADAHLTLVR